MRTRTLSILAVLLAVATVTSNALASRDGEGPEDVARGARPAAPPSTNTAQPAGAQTQAPAQPRVTERPQGIARDPSGPMADTLQPAPIDPNAPDKPPGPWDFSLYGYLRAGYDYTFKDSRYDFVGRNNGFVLDAARIGAQGRNREYNVTFRISLEGASDVLSAPNTPQGTLSVRLRDAFARWDPVSFAGIQVGQFKAPFQEEELRGTQGLLFASRAVGVEGVAPGRGFQLPGIELDRQLGVMVSPVKPIGGDVALSYYLMVMNGNGPNQLLDDNGRVGLVARTELDILKYVRVGAAVFRNERTVGTPPNLYNEDDVGLTGDLTVNAAGLEAFAAVTRVRTVFPTVGTSARVQLAYHAQAGYRFEVERVQITPAYRYAYFHPWQAGGGSGFDSFRLQYHTLGVRIAHAKLPVTAWVNYTLTGEQEGRKLTNDRIEILGQVTF
jgi:hypothetical protein